MIDEVLTADNQEVPEEVQGVPTLTDLADKLGMAKKTKQWLADQVKINNQSIEDLQKELWELMVDNDLQSFNYKGTTFALSETVYGSPVAGMATEVYDWLKTNGYDSLVKETVNANSLSALIRELMEGSDGLKDISNIPEDLASLLNIYPRQIISMTKSNKGGNA